MNSAYRELLYPIDSPRLTPARGLDPRTFGKIMRAHEVTKPFIDQWDSLYAEPYHGLTCDGACQHDLFPIADEGAPVARMVTAARTLLAQLDGEQRRLLLHPIDAREWRLWSNPEFLINDSGLRLEDLAPPARDGVLQLIESCMSSSGFAKTRDCMRTNAFLGELCQLQTLMNEWSYNIQLFGEPSLTEPWGWNLYGHHLCLNCFVFGKQMVISPTFMGAEPNEIDAGPFAGTRLFQTEESEGLRLMRSLPSDLRDRAQIYRSMTDDPTMASGRWHAADGFHLGGAFQDNRIVPFEGIAAHEMSKSQRDTLLTVVEAFIEYLPGGPRAARMRQIEAHLDATWWSWIGGYGDSHPFYYRIQSPVIMVEFDHHAGVWLTNSKPAKCHIHTVVRTPNGNDYGRDLLRQHFADRHSFSVSGDRN